MFKLFSLMIILLSSQAFAKMNWDCSLLEKSTNSITFSKVDGAITPSNAEINECPQIMAVATEKSDVYSASKVFNLSQSALVTMDNKTEFKTFKQKRVCDYVAADPTLATNPGSPPQNRSLECARPED